MQFARSNAAYVVVTAESACNDIRLAGLASDMTRRRNLRLAIAWLAVSVMLPRPGEPQTMSFREGQSNMAMVSSHSMRVQHDRREVMQSEELEHSAL